MVLNVSRKAFFNCHHTSMKCGILYINLSDNILLYNVLGHAVYNLWDVIETNPKEDYTLVHTKVTF